MLKALHRFTQLLRVHIYVPGCCKYIRMTNGLQPLVELYMDGCFADFPDLRFSQFADAAFARTCGTSVVATQRTSSIRSFMGVVLAGTETVLSLHADQTNKTPD